MSVLRWPEKMPEGGLLSKGKDAYDLGKGKVRDPHAGCEQILHISLFFDGTNNNDDESNKAFRDSKWKAHTNVARLHAAAREEHTNGIYRYYIAGVGTALPEVGETEYSSIGKGFAVGYGRRCVWAYTRVLNAVYQAIAGSDAILIDNIEAKALCLAAADGFRPFSSVFDMKHKKLAGMQRDRKRDSHRNKMVKQVWINAFGFSRGAAGARSFIGKLTRDWAPGGKIAGEIPYKINFMGLFDTVASVGPPDSFKSALDISVFDGHFAWSNDGLMNIPKDVQRCVHFFSIHEQRMSFPLDTIREGSAYPGGPGQRLEVAFPGVHSDVGGGYPPGDQGKARDGDGDKLSQIPLHQMYIEALRAGVPLQLEEEIIRVHGKQHDLVLNEPLIDAFNRWLDRTVEISRVEDALRFGMRQSLAWRTLRARWNKGDYVTQQPFFLAAHEDGMTPHQLEQQVEKAMKTDAEAIKIRKRIDELADARTTLGLAGMAQEGYISADQMQEGEKLDKQARQAWDVLQRRREQKYQEVARAKDKTRPGEGAAETVTNDQHDLREAAEEFRLLLGYLHPEQRASLGVELSPMTPRPPAVGAHMLCPLRVPLAAYTNPTGQYLCVPRENDPDSKRVLLIPKDFYVQTAVFSEFDAEKFDVLVLPARDMLDQLRAWTAPAVVDQFARQEQAAIALFDNYVHDSRAWFRVPDFHEYAPGGYGWARVLFIGHDNCVRHLGFGTDALVKSVNTSPKPTPAEMAMHD